MVDDEFVGHNFTIQTVSSAAKTGSFANLPVLTIASLQCTRLSDLVKQQSFLHSAFCISTTVLYLRPNALNLRDECWFGCVELWTSVFFCLRVGSDEISAFYEVISPRLFRSGSEIEMPSTRRSAEVRKSCFRFGLYADVNDDCACPITWRENGTHTLFQRIDDRDPHLQYETACFWIEIRVYQHMR